MVFLIWDSFWFDSLVKGLWIPRLPLDFRFCHQLWTAITFSKIIRLQNFWVFWKATDLNRSFLAKKSSRNMTEVSPGTHPLGGFHKNYDLEACTTPPNTPVYAKILWESHRVASAINSFQNTFNSFQTLLARGFWSITKKTESLGTRLLGAFETN